MFSRILLKSLRGRDSRQWVAFLAVVIATSVAATLLTIRADTGAKINSELRAFGANLILTPATARDSQTFSVSAMQRLPWPVSSDTLRGVAPVLYGVLHHIGPNDSTRPLVALGTDFAAMRHVNSFWSITPAVRHLNEDEILLGQAAARKLNLAAGQITQWRAAVTGDTASFRLAGIVSTGETEDDQIILNLYTLQKLLRQPDQATLALASVQGGPVVVEALVAAFSHHAEGIQAQPIRKIAGSEAHILRILTLLMSIVSAFTVIVATLCLGTTMTALIVERQQEVGVMKAIGAENRHVVRLIAAELALLGLGGGLVGYWVGFFFAGVISKNVFNTYASLRLEILPLVLMLALGISLVAAIFPLRRALQVEPTVALRGE